MIHSGSRGRYRMEVGRVARARRPSSTGGEWRRASLDTDRKRRARTLIDAGGWGNRDFNALPTVCERQEFANTLTGGLGLLGSLIGLGLLIDLGQRMGSTGALVTATIYGLSLVLSYLATTLYHGARCHERKARLRVLDHCAVYVLIAGSYTPVALAGVGGRAGWTLLAVVWLLAALGVLFKLRFRFRFPGTSVVFYLVMGWLGVFMIGKMATNVGAEAVTLIAAGGVAFTIGTIFFGAKRLPYHHALWHLMVITGSALHFVAMFDHVLPPLT